jgi:PEP-CTERM motif
MKKLLLTLACLTLVCGAAFSQTASFSLTDNGLYGGTNTTGTFNPNDTFTLSLYGTFSGFTANGYSAWLETQILNAFNTTLNITNETYFTWTGPNDDPNDYTNPADRFPKAFTDTSGASSGYRSDINTKPEFVGGPTNTGDLGATGAPQAAGTYHLADITFSLTNAPLGTYTLQTTTVSPKVSEIADTSFGTHAATAGTYTLTIAAVPEPATWSLIGLGGLASVGLNVLRRRRGA